MIIRWTINSPYTKKSYDSKLCKNILLLISTVQVHGWDVVNMQNCCVVMKLIWPIANTIPYHRGLERTICIWRNPFNRKIWSILQYKSHIVSTCFQSFIKLLNYTKLFPTTLKKGTLKVNVWKRAGAFVVWPTPGWFRENNIPFSRNEKCYISVPISLDCNNSSLNPTFFFYFCGKRLSKRVTKAFSIIYLTNIVGRTANFPYQHM